MPGPVQKYLGEKALDGLKDRRQNSESGSARQASAKPREVPRRRRLWLFRLVALSLPFLLLALLEVVLRLTGYGYSPAFFVEQQDAKGRKHLINSETFSLRFFPPQLARWPTPFSIAAEKPAGVRRIFILGESAAMGDPQPAYGASRYLEVLLRERFPGEKCEVVNLGITAINSHVILPIARECATRQGDAWIVYMGNNEMVGPFGAATIFGTRAPPLPAVRLYLALQKTRLGQLGVALMRKLGPNQSASWGGMQMFRQNRIYPSDPRKETIYRSFQRNLRDILQAGRNAGVKMILSTVAVNLRGCPPFASMADPKQPAVEREQFQALYARAIEHEQAADFSQAARLFEQAGSSNQRFAELQFRWGRCLLGMTNLAGARAHFQLACDFDALPFRADSRINGAIRAVGKEMAGDDLVLCDPEADLRGVSPVGVPGDESFFEHVHFNFNGNYRLALVWAEQVKRLLFKESPATSPWAAQAECERELGLSDYNRACEVRAVMERMGQPPLSSQFNNAERRRWLQAEETRLQQSFREGGSEARARELYRLALQRTPQDSNLYEGLGNFMEYIGDYPGAVAAYRRLLEIHPHDCYSRLRLGHLLGTLGEQAQAAEMLSQVVELRPYFPGGWYELGAVQAARGRFQLAVASYQRACELRPAEPSYVYAKLYCEGRRLAELNRHAEAVEQYRKAIELVPGNWEAHFHLAGELDAANQLDAALNEFAGAARLNPGYSRAHFNYGVLLAKHGRYEEAEREFEATARLEPGYAKAQEYLKQVQSLKGNKL